MSRRNNKAAKAILNRESKAAEQVCISVCCGIVQVVSLLCSPVGVIVRLIFADAFSSHDKYFQKSHKRLVRFS